MNKKIVTPWGLVLLSALFLCLGLGIRLFRYGDATALIGFGCHSTSRCLARENQGVLPHPALVFPSGGYDGQFYYYLAAELGGGEEARLDDPVLRKSRIAFPAFLSIFFYFGKANLLLWAMIVAPILLHLFSVYQTLDLIQKQGLLDKNTKSATAYLSLLALALNPFVLLSAGLGLADAYASSLALLSLLVLIDPSGKKAAGPRKKIRYLLSSALLTFAFLSKETSIAFYPVFLSLLWQNMARQHPPKNESPETTKKKKKKIREKAIYLFSQGRCLFLCLVLLPPAALLTWWIQIGFVPWKTAGGHAGPPFSGILWFANNPDAFLSGRTWLFVLTAILVLLLALWLRCIWQSRDSYATGLMGLLLANLCLLLLSTEEYWMNFANIARLFVPASYLPVLTLLGEKIERKNESPLLPIKETRIEKALLACLAGSLLLLSAILIRDALYGKILEFVVWP